MNVPEISRSTFTPLASSALRASPAMFVSSSSLTPPRLLTRSTTRSLPLFLNGRNERSVSVVEVRNSTSWGKSWLRGGMGESRR